MVSSDHKELSIVKQCRLLSLSRSGWYYEPRGESTENLEMMRLIDTQFLKTPYYGSRQMMRHLQRQGHSISRHRVRRLMHLIGIEAVYQKPNTSQPHPEHRVYPYLLKGLAITRSNQVWCTDITYIPVKRGFLYLIAIMDWYSRKVLSWRLSHTMDTRFCIEALEEAFMRYGKPDIFNTDQGSQFTSLEFTETLNAKGIRISMDGKGRWMDNVFIERLWRSLKYECVYLNAFEDGLQAKGDIAHWLNFYNQERPHSVFNGQTPNEVYHQLHDGGYNPHHEVLAA